MNRSRTRLIAASLLASAGLGVTVTATTANAASIGTVPPATPSANCLPPASITSALAKIDFCRAAEGVGPLTLPSNWGSLSVPEQELVVFNLERTARGLTPIVGLSAALDTLSQTAAEANTDPAFPTSGILGGGGVWAAIDSTLDADYAWMYDDGPGSENLDCTASDPNGCWGHRDNILINGADDPLIGGGGFAAGSGVDGDNSYAFEMDYVPAVDSAFTADAFTWTGELSNFSSAPAEEPLGTTTSPGAGGSATTPPTTVRAPSATPPAPATTTTPPAPSTATTTLRLPSGQRVRITVRSVATQQVAITLALVSGTGSLSAVARHGGSTVRLTRRAGLHTAAELGARLSRGNWSVTVSVRSHGSQRASRQTFELRIS